MPTIPSESLPTELRNLIEYHSLPEVLGELNNVLVGMQRRSSNLTANRIYEVRSHVGKAYDVADKYFKETLISDDED